MNTRVGFRVDSGTHIGAGHLTRCLTLASRLSDGGAKIRFVARAHDGHLLDLAEAAGHEVCLLYPRAPTTSDPRTWLGASPEEDARESVTALMGIGSIDLLVVDHYGADARWHAVVRGQCRQLVAIDDLADRPLDVDVVLDHNYGAEAKPYVRLAPDAELLLGPGYALLDDRFATAREAAGTRGPRPEREARVVIALGGTDPSNVTTWVLGVLIDDLRHAAAVDVVIGRSHPSPRTVERACERIPNAVLHVQTDDMAGLLTQADLAIGAGGVSTLERCCVGVPTIGLALARNQLPALRSLDRDGLLVHVERFQQDPESLQRMYRTLMTDIAWRERIRDAGRRVVDGKGADRVAGHLTRSIRSSWGTGAGDHG